MSFSSQAEIGRRRKLMQEARAAIARGDRDVSAAIDVWWEADAMPEMPLIAGVLVVGQRLYRRLVTPRGFFRTWPNDGLGLTKYLLTKPQLWVIKNDVEAECLRDQQVEKVLATPQFSQSGSLLTLDIFFTTTFGAAADMTMTATEAATTLLSIRKAA
jgi:hypothetical protein